MTLIKCPECGRKVSSRAVVCPACAYPLDEAETAPTTNRSNHANAEHAKKKLKIGFALSICLFIIGCSGLLVEMPTMNSNPSGRLVVAIWSIFALAGLSGLVLFRVLAGRNSGS